jgi:hypothetical protein
VRRGPPEGDRPIVTIALPQRGNEDLRPGLILCYDRYIAARPPCLPEGLVGLFLPGVSAHGNNGQRDVAVLVSEDSDF